MAVLEQAADPQRRVARDDAARDRADQKEGTAFVYVISAGDTVQKIGITRSHPKRRMRALQTAAHAKLALAGAVEVAASAAANIEQRTHRLLHDRRQAGEWFAVSVADAVSAVERAAGVPCRLPGPERAVVSPPPIVPATCRAARGYLDWTQAHLAQTARVAPSTIRNYETGRSVPTVDNLMAVQLALEAAGVTFIPAGAGGGAGVRLRRS